MSDTVLVFFYIVVGSIALGNGLWDLVELIRWEIHDHMNKNE